MRCYFLRGGQLEGVNMLPRDFGPKRNREGR